MNNREKYKNTIDKIEISDEAVQKAINNARKYRSKGMLNIETKNKISKIKNAIITITALLGVSAASYAGYVAVKGNNGTMTYKNTTKVELEGSEEIIETIEHKGVNNGGISYDIETPAEIIVTHDGTTDRYASIYNDDVMQNGQGVPDVYMDIKILDASEKEELKMHYANQTSDVHVYTGTIGQENYPCISYDYHFGMSWDAECHSVHIIDINEEKFMLIDVRTFMEASEGWAVKFAQLLSTLKIYVEN